MKCVRLQLNDGRRTWYGRPQTQQVDDGVTNPQRVSARSLPAVEFARQDARDRSCATPYPSIRPNRSVP